MARAQGYLLALLLLTGNACHPSESPQTGSQTNWLRACNEDAACGAAEACRCNVCTSPCSVDAACGALPGSTCVAAEDPGVVALCGGAPPPSVGLCLPRCGSTVCAEGQICVAGLCNPLPTPTATVTVDASTALQVLTGIGATLAYAEPSVVNYPNAEELAELMFAGLGLDILRLRNRFGYTGDDDLASAAAIVSTATQSLGRRPVVILTSWSPPASFKANTSVSCHANPDTCTLNRLPSGSFDYAGYAAYWRDSLEAYRTAGVVPDHVSMQNNPDYVPTGVTTGEACKFLPREGVATVTVDGVDRTLRFPGYAEALGAVSASLAGFEPAPHVIAPDASTPAAVGEYVDALEPTMVGAIGHHLYGITPTSPELSAFESLRELSASRDLPLFQTEAYMDGIGTAISMHHVFATEGASAYLHSGLVGPAATSSVDPGAMLVITANGVDTQTQYHALKHFSRHTDPGWSRVLATSGSEALLATAWLSPTERALSVILINTGDEGLDLELTTPDAWSSARVYRTAFEGTERHADLGALAAERVLHLPPHAMATVAFER